MRISAQTLLSILPVLHALAVLLITAGGLALALQVRKMAFRLLVAGAAVAVLAAMAATPLSLGFSMSMLDLITAVCGILALCAWALKLRRPAFVLGTIAFAHWAVWPAVLWAMSLVPPWILVAILLPTGVFIAIWLLQHTIELWYGDDAAAHVAGTYLVRTLDAIGRGVRWIFTSPLRLLRRRVP